LLLEINLPTKVVENNNKTMLLKKFLFFLFILLFDKIFIVSVNYIIILIQLVFQLWR